MTRRTRTTSSTTSFRSPAKLPTARPDSTKPPTRQVFRRSRTSSFFRGGRRGRARPNLRNMDTLREHVLYLLKGGGAHADFESAIKGLPVELRGKRPRGAEHSPWQILEHMRLAQWDILEFSRDAKHVSPKWPEGYWPEKPTPPNASAWAKTVKQFRADLDAMRELVAADSTDLFAPIPHGSGQ